MARYNYWIWVQDTEGKIYTHGRYIRFSAAMRRARDTWWHNMFTLRYKAWAIVRETRQDKQLVAAVIVAQSRKWDGQRTYTDLVPRKAA